VKPGLAAAVIVAVSGHVLAAVVARCRGVCGRRVEQRLRGQPLELVLSALAAVAADGRARPTNAAGSRSATASPTREEAERGVKNNRYDQAAVTLASPLMSV
jgi:hypothetical protein